MGRLNKNLCHVTVGPKTPEMTLKRQNRRLIVVFYKKTLLSLKGITRFCANLDETKADTVQFTKRWN